MLAPRLQIYLSTDLRVGSEFLEDVRQFSSQESNENQGLLTREEEASVGTRLEIILEKAMNPYKQPTRRGARKIALAAGILVALAAAVTVAIRSQGRRRLRNKDAENEEMLGI